MTLKSFSVGSRQVEDAGVFPDSVAVDNVEDDGSGRYAEQLLDHAGPCGARCSCQGAHTCFLSSVSLNLW